jgi:hypothetical protein
MMRPPQAYSPNKGGSLGSKALIDAFNPWEMIKALTWGKPSLSDRPAEDFQMTTLEVGKGAISPSQIYQSRMKASVSWTS